MLLPILLTLALLAISVPLVAAPLRRNSSATHRQPVGDSAAEATPNYEETLLALRDLEFDHELGAVSDGDYNILREELVALAAASLARRPGAGRDVAVAEIEAAVRSRREQRQPGHARFCPQCGRPGEAGDRFCVGCGNPLR